MSGPDHLSTRFLAQHVEIRICELYICKLFLYYYISFHPGHDLADDKYAIVTWFFQPSEIPASKLPPESKNEVSFV